MPVIYFSHHEVTMFDNLRDSAESSSFYEEEPNDLYREPVATTAAAPRRRVAASNGRLLGMTAQQRFLIAVMLLFTVCIMGTLAMFVFEKMSLF
jgi:hypothetical protein